MANRVRFKKMVFSRRLSHCAMVMPLYFLPMLSSLSTDMCKQVTSRQHLMQGDSNGINMRLLFCMCPLALLRLLSI